MFKMRNQLTLRSLTGLNRHPDGYICTLLFQLFVIQPGLQLEPGKFAQHWAIVHCISCLSRFHSYSAAPVRVYNSRSD
jgi:hypothetical protein